jgi:hypothetical protein
MGKTAKNRVGRPAGRTAPHRPVVSARVPQELYDAITNAAHGSGRTISEEMIWQAQIALQIGDAQKFLSDIAHTTEDTLRAKMRAAGLKPIRSALGTYWLDGDDDMPPLKGRLDPEVKAAITDAVRDAFKSERDKS